VDSPPIYTLDTPIFYECAPEVFFACPTPSPMGNCVWVDITSFVFSETGGVLSAGPVSASFPALDGPLTTCPAGSFTLSTFIAGGCEELYTLTATFIDANTWVGTFTIDFTDIDGISCFLGGCADAMFSVSGTR
jgi:hypothetical protein